MLHCVTCPQCKLEFLAVPSAEDAWITCPRCGAEGPPAEAATRKPRWLIWFEEVGSGLLVVLLVTLSCWPAVCAGFMEGTLLPFVLLFVGLALLRVGHRGLALALPRQWAVAATAGLATLLVASWLVLMVALFAGR